MSLSREAVSQPWPTNHIYLSAVTEHGEKDHLLHNEAMTQDGEEHFLHIETMPDTVSNTVTEHDEVATFLHLEAVRLVCHAILYCTAAVQQLTL